MEGVLPTGFEPLESFVPYWSGETTQLRWDRRASASIEDIRSFYDAMLEHADAALAYLDERPIGALDTGEGRLLCLLLSLASCAIAVELHGQSRAPLSPFPHGIRVLRGGTPFGN